MFVKYKLSKKVYRYICFAAWKVVELYYKKNTYLSVLGFLGIHEISKYIKLFVSSHLHLVFFCRYIFLAYFFKWPMFITCFEKRTLAITPSRASWRPQVVMFLWTPRATRPSRTSPGTRIISLIPMFWSPSSV